jgi:hypothetical protein
VVLFLLRKPWGDLVSVGVYVEIQLYKNRVSFGKWQFWRGVFEDSG